MSAAGRDRVRLLGLMGAAWKPRAWMPLAQWSDKRRVLDARSTARSGRYKSDAVPYLLGIMEAIDDPTVRDVIVIKPTQTGLTEVIINAILRNAECRPGGTMLAMPTQDGQRAMMAEDARLSLAIDAVPELRALCPRSPKRRSMSAYNFDGMTLYAVGSATPKQGQSKPIRYLFADDGQQIPTSQFAVLDGRTTAYAGIDKRVKGGTYGVEGDGMHRLYLQGDQRVFLVPCMAEEGPRGEGRGLSEGSKQEGKEASPPPVPSLGEGVSALGPRPSNLGPSLGCGGWQELVFAGIRWQQGASRGEVAEATAYYRCACCGGRIESERKMEMLRRGVWVPTRGQEEIDEAHEGEEEGPRDEGRGVSEGSESGSALGPRPSGLGPSPARDVAQMLIKRNGAWTKRDDVTIDELLEAERRQREKGQVSVRSFAISGAMHAFEAWGRLAGEYVKKKASGDVDQLWWNERAGQAWRETGESLDERSIAGLMLRPEQGGHLFGTVPAPVLMLAAGCDLQKDRLVYEIAGYGEHGYRATIEVGELMARDQVELAAAVAKIRAMRWPLAGGHPYRALGAGAQTIGVSGGAIDSGQGLRHKEVYNVLRDAGNWFPCKGFGNWRRAVPVDISRPEKDAQGQRDPRSVHLLTLWPDHFKDRIMERLRASVRGLADDAATIGTGRWAVPWASEPAQAEAMTRWARQICAEEKVPGRVVGRSAMVWRMKLGEGQNHALDAAVYADAVAYHLRLGDRTLAECMGRARAVVAVSAKRGGEGEKGGPVAPRRGGAEVARVGLRERGLVDRG